MRNDEDKLAEKKSRILDECVFTSVRSKGPGGQNVNKVSSKVELRFNVYQSPILTDEEKQLITDKLKTRINKEGELIIKSQSERTQYKNRIRSTEKLFALLQKALVSDKKRIPTAPSQSVIQKRAEDKKRLSEKKKRRSAPDTNE